MVDSTNESMTQNTDKARGSHLHDTVHKESKHDSDINAEESHAAEIVRDSAAWGANRKRTYDEYQHESLESIRRNRVYVDKVLSDAQSNFNFRENVANQALQNAVETANMVGKQAFEHRGLMFDRQLNINETDALATSMVQSFAKNPVQMDALVALLVAKMSSDQAK